MKNLYQYIPTSSEGYLDIKDYEYDIDMFARPLLSHIEIFLHFPLFKPWHEVIMFRHSLMYFLYYTQLAVRAHFFAKFWKAQKDQYRRY